MKHLLLLKEGIRFTHSDTDVRVWRRLWSLYPREGEVFTNLVDYVRFLSRRYGRPVRVVGNRFIIDK